MYDIKIEENPEMNLEEKDSAERSLKFLQERVFQLDAQVMLMDDILDTYVNFTAPANLLYKQIEILRDLAGIYSEMIAAYESQNKAPREAIDPDLTAAPEK